MKTAHIIYNNYLNPNGEGLSVGGIQTYITNLVDVLVDLGYKISIYQRGDLEFHRTINDNLTVYGIPKKTNNEKLNQMLYDYAKKYISPKLKDILIFGSETLVVKTIGDVPVIAIQHGIYWDVPQEGLSKIKYFREYIKKQYRAWRESQILKYVDHLVCVDCNFINWYRALVPCPQVKLYYIPNFSSIPNETFLKPNSENGINIIFARRFIPKRGTRLFMQVVKRLLLEYNNLFITIAGEGPDEQLLRDNLTSYSQVKFIRYNSGESMAIHRDKHIAVVPTLGSEGTSLSLLEAMASGCAVVCTNVGGMTNIVIDNFNGLMISPEEEELFNALKRLIENEDERNQISRHAYETVVNGFSIDKWKKTWKKILVSI